MTDSEKSMFCDMLAKRGITEKQPSPSPADANAAEEAKRADEEAEKKRHAEEEAKRRAEEAEKKRKEEFDRKRALAEKKRQEDQEKVRKQNEEAARLAKEREEQEKKAREEADKKALQEANARLGALREKVLKAAEDEEEEEGDEEEVGEGGGRRMLEPANKSKSRAKVLNDADGLREVSEAETMRREAMRRNEEDRSKFQADYLRRQTERDAEAARIREEMARQEAAMQAEMTTADAMVTQLAQGILLSIQSGQMTKDQASLMLNGAMLTAEQKTKVRKILASKGIQLAK
jgi:hypothetical protein